MSHKLHVIAYIYIFMYILLYEYLLYLCKQKYFLCYFLCHFALNLVQKMNAEYIFSLTWKKHANFGGFPENVGH